MGTNKIEYQVPEHLVLADKLNAKKQHRKLLEQRLDDRIFKYSCMPMKQEISAREVDDRLATVICLTIMTVILLVLVLGSLIYMVIARIKGTVAEGFVAVQFMIGILMLIPNIPLCVQLWKDTLWHATKMSLNIREEQSLSIKITDLQEEMAALDKEIAELEICFQEARDKAAAKYL